MAQLRKELATANELVSTKTSELNISMSSPSAARGSSLEQQQHGGLTVTQVLYTLLHVCICVYVCVHACMHVCLSVCVSTCVCVYMHACTRAFVSVCVHDAVVSLHGQMYIKFAQSQEELRQAQDEVTRLTNYLEHIRQGACA